MIKKTVASIITSLVIAHPAFAAIENLDEMDARKARRATNTYYSGESSSNGWNRQSESLMYTDTRTGNEVWVLSNTPNKSNIYYTDISPANPWSADGARMGFFSNRPVSEFSRTYGSVLDGGYASTFTVSTDGSHLRAAYDSSERTWSISIAAVYFYWSPVVPDVYYQTGGRTNGLALDYGAIYKNTVTDSGTTYSKLVDLPGADTDAYGMKKVISPDGKYLLPKKDGIYYPVKVFPENEAGLVDATGWAEDRGQAGEWGAGTSISGCRHDVYFPSPDFFVVLFSSFECPTIQNIFYNYDISGSDTDGGPDYDNAETTYATWRGKEAEPMWNAAGITVPWKLEPATSKHWWGHPGFDRWGRTATFGDGNGYQLIGETLYEYGGPVTWDYRNRKLEAQPAGTLYPQVLVNRAATYNDHNAWSDYFALSNNGSTGTELDMWVGTAEYNKTAANGNDFRMVSYHYQNQNESTSYHWDANNRVAQSPDGTKISYAITFLTSVPDTGDLAYAVAYYPHPPEITSVTGTGTYTIRFDWRTDQTTSRGYTQRGWPDESTNNPPPPRETKLFRLWRSTDGATWTPITTVNAEIFSRYNFSTGVWTGNNYWTITDTPGAGTFYYAVTAQEHSGLESRVLSNVFSTAGTQTAAYPSDPKASTGVTNTYQASAIRHYNIYAEDATTPTPTQQNRIATIPVVEDTTYVDWLGNPDGTTKYTVTALDTQGNESAAIDNTTTHKASPATADGQYTITWEGTGEAPVSGGSAAFTGSGNIPLSGSGSMTLQ